MYFNQIFLGGWGNTKSSIRKNNEEPDKVIVDTPKILNNGEARGFWIKWGGGFIGVGKQGDEKPFMSWQDEESLNVLFYGVRSGWGSTGVWTIEGLFAYHQINLINKIFVNLQIIIKSIT